MIRRPFVALRLMPGPGHRTETNKHPMEDYHDGHAEWMKPSPYPFPQGERANDPSSFRGSATDAWPWAQNGDEQAPDGGLP